MPLLRTILGRAPCASTLIAVILATFVFASANDVPVRLFEGPLAFEPNVGQLDGRVDSGADYIARGPGYGIALTATEAVIMVAGQGPEAGRNAEIRMRLLDARDDASVEAVDALAGRTHYYSGSTPDTWMTDVPNFGRVRVTDVYEGIDLVYYGKQGQLEYDFVVAPGIDPGVVGMAFRGADGLDLIGGDLIIETRAGRLTLERPFTYQDIDGERREIESAYVLDEDRNVRFELGTYDRTRPLVIDPTLTYFVDFGLEDLLGFTFFSARDNALAVAVEPLSGEVYVAGTWVDILFPGPADGFVVKFSNTGQRLWTALLRGNAEDVAYGIAVDGGGNAYVAGQTSSTNFPNFPGSGALPNSGISDGFVLKLNPDGNALGFASLLGGANADRTDSVRLAPNGDLLVAGSAQSQIAGITGTADTSVWNTYLAQIDTTSGAIVSGLDVGMPAQAGTTIKMATGPNAGEVYLAGTDPTVP